MRLVALALAVAWAAAAQSAGWSAMGTGASVAAEGQAVALHYEIGDGKNSGMAMAAPAAMAHMQRLRFRVKPDHATALGVVLSEKKPGGGNYIAWLWARANEWQDVELTPADFTASDAPNDAVGADGRLDLDQVESIGLFDLTQFFATLRARGGAAVVVDDAPGPHTLWVDGFAVSTEPPAGRPAQVGSRGVREWVTPGGMDLKISDSENPLGAPALVASYQRVEGAFVALVRREPARESAKATRIEFDIASEHEGTVIVALEERKPGGGEGPRYTLPIFPPGGREPFHVELKLADFRGPEGAGPFDPAKWRTTVLMDVTNADGGSPGNNTMWVGNVQALGQ